MVSRHLQKIRALLRNRSLKAKITFSFMIIVLCISLALSFLYYTSQREQYRHNLIRTNTNDANYLMGNLERQLRHGEQLANWFFVNNSMQPILMRDYSNDRARFGRDAPPVIRLINEQLASSAIGRHVVFLHVSGNNNVVLRGGNADAYFVGNLAYEQWFSSGMDYIGGLLWSGIYENPARYRSSQMILPITRPILYAGTRIEIGWHVLAFSPNLVSDAFEDFHMDDSRFVVVLDREHRVVFHNNSEDIGHAIEYSFLEEGQNLNGSYFVDLAGRQMLVTGRHSTYSGMTLLLFHSLEGFEAQATFNLTILLGIVTLVIVLFLLLTYYLTKRLTMPLNRVLGRLHDIAGGDFTIDPSIEGSDEMGLIGQGVNEMSTNIASLMDDLVQNEHKRTELEYKVLLNQINPHFVYNVLNSIKVMADIQEIEGISEMASSLGSLLKEMSKGATEYVTIRRELELLKSYLHIQHIRRCGMLTTHYDVPDNLLDYLIPRFTLQPLAENAIYHGLDKNDGMGIIEISMHEESDELVIVMRDNGAGIPQERVGTLLDEPSVDGKEKLNHVGLHNVNERIKLFSEGVDGLFIESREGEYTKVTVRLPIKSV